MAKVRVFGRRGLLPATLAVLQDFGALHLDEDPTRDEALAVAELPEREKRERRLLEAARADCDAALTALRAHLPPSSRRASRLRVASAVATARALRSEVESHLAAIAALEEERALLERHRAALEAFAPLVRLPTRLGAAHAEYVVLRSGGDAAVERLRGSLRGALGDAFELRSRALPNGEIALMVLVPEAQAQRVDGLLAAARVEDVPVPMQLGATLAEALPRLASRLSELPRESDARHGELAELARRATPALLDARRCLVDRLARFAAREHARLTPRVFVLEGWLPRDRFAALARQLDSRLGPDVAVGEVRRERWSAGDAPVVLRNPRLFRPFEALLAPLPLPAYGTIDPTPFVAIFFPALFGLMLGDIGYGLLLGGAALVLLRHSLPGSRRRALAEVAAACALATVVFGALYGELFGDLGRRLLGLRPVLLDRESAVVPFLGLAVSLGLVHVLLGLLLGAAASFRREPRKAAGKGLAALMLALVAAALASVLDLLPRSFFTPLTVALLVSFPLLVLVEGLVAPLELLATLGNVLSYARVMALGLASVMLAVVANRLAGTVGVAAVGVVFALLFHLVNFALGLFGPTLHALRLHYVEFFGKFYSPGGVEYRPFAHADLSGDRSS